MTAAPTTARVADDRDGRPALLEDQQGVVYVEYLAVLTLVTLIGAAATAALGLPLLRLFRYAETIILLPIP